MALIRFAIVETNSAGWLTSLMEVDRRLAGDWRELDYGTKQALYH